MALMLARLERYGSDSDIALFNELLYVGEFLLKITTAAMVAGVEDDRENHRYRLLHSLVRSDGIGEWARALDEVLSGPTSQVLATELSDVRRAYTERVGKLSWQREAVSALQEVLEGVHQPAQPLGEKVALRAWFQMFTELRNKTRGHGAITPASLGR